MSVKIEMHLDGDIYPLEKFSWGFSQGTNSNGMPSNKIRQKGLHVSTIMVRNDELEAWAYHNHLKKDLEIHIIPNILGTERTRIIKCTECFLIELETEYHNQSKQQTMQHLFITFGRVEANWSTAVYKENWAQEPMAETANTVIEEDPILVDGYFTNLKGERIPNNTLKDGLEVYYVIETQNAIGHVIDLDLSDSKNDFKYEGQLLPNDILEDLKITSDTQKVKLEVIRQIS